MPGVRHAVAGVMAIGCVGKLGRAAEGNDKLPISSNALSAVLGPSHPSGSRLACGWLVDIVGSDAILALMD